MRLEQGDFGAETIYDDDPVRVAREFDAAGVGWIHVVDLDGARTGERAHFSVIADIAKAVTCAIEVGGGVRTAAAAADLLDAGVARVVVGTAAIEQPALVDDLCRQYPGRIAVGLDARGAEVAVRGWVEGSGVDLVEVARQFDRAGIGALIVTEIGRDGTLAGPAVEQLSSVLGATTVPVIASGGVGSLDDIRSLARLRVNSRRLDGVIVGRALYEGCFTIDDAMAVVAE